MQHRRKLSVNHFKIVEQVWGVTKPVFHKTTLKKVVLYMLLNNKGINKSSITYFASYMNSKEEGFKKKLSKN